MLKVDIKVPKLKPIDLQAPLRKACTLVEASAKMKVPVDTGTLKRSIKTTLYDTYGEVGTNVEYAPYVEFGTGLFNPTGRKTP